MHIYMLPTSRGLSASSELHRTSTVVKVAFKVPPDTQTLVNELHRTSTVHSGENYVIDLC